MGIGVRNLTGAGNFSDGTSSEATQCIPAMLTPAACAIRPWSIRPLSTPAVSTSVPPDRTHCSSAPHCSCRAIPASNPPTITTCIIEYAYQRSGMSAGRSWREVISSPSSPLGSFER